MRIFSSSQNERFSPIVFYNLKKNVEYNLFESLLFDLWYQIKDFFSDVQLF